MVLWICIAVVVVALIVLAILVFDVLGHLKRLQKAVKVAQDDTAPYVAVLMSLANVARPTVAKHQTVNESHLDVLAGHTANEHTGRTLETTS
ncbi:hypothetical protein CLV47_10611 [Antricoccus suffuscus]|uniref:Uncharacterized protein n=1 Tax=Antricoccus suffuscus TaxID=1629062 RepID=A0A2T1A0K9_9ACTN|nr:hypothetical protein [Antricoccus suffuscus]PRZ42141.1 hypothetical protein CLV47_10611 [Antricoccus suffuscus]